MMSLRLPAFRFSLVAGWGGKSPPQLRLCLQGAPGAVRVWRTARGGAGRAGRPWPGCCFHADDHGQGGVWRRSSPACRLCMFLGACFPSRYARSRSAALTLRSQLGGPLNDQLASRPGWAGIVTDPYNAGNSPRPPNAARRGPPRSPAADRLWVPGLRWMAHRASGGSPSLAHPLPGTTVVVGKTTFDVRVTTMIV